jgi:cyclohexa-1,5-dienecarbonyl-CoA hydratase
MAKDSTIQTRLEGRTACLTLDRPPLNVLDIAAMRELDSALVRVLPQCDFLVLQGEGPKGFSAGAEVGDHVQERVREMLSAFHSIFRRLARAECITIAAVHGNCLGGGMELATFCDFVIAAESAKFGQPEIKLACFPPIAMLTLPHLCGFRAAIDLILTGRTISAEESRRLGLVSRIEKDAELQQGVNKLLGELARMSASVLRLTRRTLWRMHVEQFEQQLDEIEHIYFEQLMRTSDAHEGIRAFIEKRAPVWQAR